MPLTRRLLGGVWSSVFRVKSPCYDVKGCMGNARYAHDSVGMLTVASLPTALLIGCLVGAGHVGGFVAGPAGTISAAVAAAAIGLSGICYAELRARWPRVAGSPYEYIYLSVGEGVAFLIGWLSIIQSVVVAATAARAAGQNVDCLLDGAVRNWTEQTLGCFRWLGSCPDLPAGGATVLVLALTVGGVRRHQRLLAGVVSIMAGTAVLFALVVSLFHIDFDLWRRPEDFFPFSYPGVISGAATIFYGFSCYETICSKTDFSQPGAGRRAVGASTVHALCGLALFTALVSVLTLLAPIGLLRTEVPFPEAFTHADVYWMKYVPGVTAVLAMPVFTWTALWWAHDQLEALSLDALLCPRFSDVSQRTGAIPLAALVPGLAATLMAVALSIENLLQLGSLCCLLVAIVNCAAVVSIRFRPSMLVHSPGHTTRRDRQERRRQRKLKQRQCREAAEVGGGGGSALAAGYGSVGTNNNLSSDDCALLNMNSDDDDDDDPLSWSPDDDRGGHVLEQLCRSRGDDDDDEESSSPVLRHNDSCCSSSSDTDIDDAVEEYREKLRMAALASCTFTAFSMESPTDGSARRAAWCVLAFLLGLLGISTVLARGGEAVRTGNVPLILVLVVFLLVAVASLLLLLRYPQDPLTTHDLCVSVPLSPWLPLLALVVNVHLALQLSNTAWTEVLVLLILGCVVYFAYGIRNSRASHFYQFLPEEETVLLPEPPRHQTEPRVVGPVSQAPLHSSGLLSEGE